MQSSTDTTDGARSYSTSSGQSWGQWAKETAAKGNPLKVLSMANLGRGIDVLDRNQRRAERIGDSVLNSATEAESNSEGDDVGGVHFGDNQYPAPIFLPPSGNQSPIGPLAAIAIAGLLGGGGLATGLAVPYLFNKFTSDEQPTPIVQPSTDETVSIGFGKVDGGIAEYLEANP